MTKFGKRKLKRWLCAPLLDVDKINERLDAVEDIRRNEDIIDLWYGNASGFSDFERMCSRLYSYSVKQNTKINLFQDISTLRLKELKSFFQQLK